MVRDDYGGTYSGQVLLVLNSGVAPARART
jgi:hypothetical protein